MPDDQNTSLPYGFRGRLRQEFPSQIIADISEVCNLACSHCPHPEFSKSKHYAGRLLEEELNAKMVGEVGKHGRGITQFIRYSSNGEPTSHPQCFAMIADAVSRSGAAVALTTNAKALDPRRNESLLATGLDLVDISIDAYREETYAKIRVKGDLKVTRANVIDLIRQARQVQGKKTRVVVSYIEQPLNQEETGLFEQFWKDQGADFVVIRRWHSCAGAKEELAEQRRRLTGGMSRRPCLYPWERIVLTARGDLAFCPCDWIHGSSVVDYRTTTIRDTWNGAFYKALREAHIANDYSHHDFCGQCPDWEATRWPHQDRSYADMIEDFRKAE